MPDKMYLENVWRCGGHGKLNWENPQTYNEKLQWLKVYDHNPLYTKLVDKYEAKEWAGKLIGLEYIISTLGVYDSFDQIDFDKLPDQFVIKCTHDSGSVVVCEDKKKLNIKETRKIIEKGLKRNFYYSMREWPYKNCPHRIIIEKYTIDTKTNSLPDYKFFCFDGEVKLMFIATDRQDKQTETKFDFFDKSFNHLEFTNGHPMADVAPYKPEKYDEMIRLAEILSKNIPHVRVDFYEANGKVYFGEMTFYHWSGLVPFVPQKWDSIIGSYIKLPQKQYNE